MEEVDQSYGVDSAGLMPLDESLSAVRVLVNTLNFSEEMLSRLRATVDPLTESSNHAIELYEQTVALLSH